MSNLIHSPVPFEYPAEVGTESSLQALDARTGTVEEIADARKDWSNIGVSASLPAMPAGAYRRHHSSYAPASPCGKFRPRK